MASWMGSKGRDGVFGLIRQRLDDQSLEDPTPRILRRFLEQKLGLKDLELDDDTCKQQIKEMINEVLQEDDEVEPPPKKTAAKSSKSKAKEPKEKTSMPKSSPLYTNLRKLCQATGLNPNKLVNSQMYLPEKVTALKKALVDAGFQTEQLKNDTIQETIELAEASRFAKEHAEDTIAPRGRRRAAAVVDYKAIYAKETAGIEGIDSEAESENGSGDVEEEVESEEDEVFSINESGDDEASELSPSEEESEVEEKPRKRSARGKPASNNRGRGRARRKQESSDDDEDESESEEEEQEEEDAEQSDEESAESAPKKKSKKN